MGGKLAVKSLDSFVGDLDASEYKRLNFPHRCENFDIYNFLFFNFNYTSIFDNFIYLDRKQFDPMPYATVDRNFSFEGNPKGIAGARVRPGNKFSSYVMTEIVHPHGIQGVPRSLLFGIDMPATINGNQDQALRLAKPFWAQNAKRYEHLFKDTELFIIFGCSLGESDRWWWKNVAESLCQERSYAGSSNRFFAEVIIYWYDAGKDLTPDEVKIRFLEAAGVMDRRRELEPFIHVVIYNAESDRTWLRTLREV
ncbi:AbiH family protein [Rathayibacter toxicus]|uniref:AbiH family protein n=1 Tax=Rathayibacter toxicus TaxID=145458 RepID=UPI001C057FBD|nr:AbiH family protein [Rathayibacter toxicus]QWL30910.1 hypothetical protein E2R34_09260 [Rathayibacter toxicus]